MVALLAQHGESGVAFEEIRTKIYPEDVNSASLRRKFNRDRSNLRKLYGEVLKDDEIDERDLEEIVTIKENSEGRYVMESRFNFMLPMKLDEKQLLVLIAGVSMAGHFLPPFSQASREVMDKLRKRVLKDALEKSKKIADSVASTVPISQKVSGDDFMKVIDAIEKKRVLKIGQYTERDGRLSTCTLSPYILYHKFHSWYVMGDAPGKKNPDQPAFRLDRMKAVEILDESQPHPLSDEALEILKKNIALDFNPAKPDEEYRVKLRITGSFAQPCMETEWFPGEKKMWEKDGDGNKSVHYEVTLKGLESITLWIMRALDCVEVLEPKKLADEIDRRVGAYLEHKDKGRTR
ncbi:WYL domain-containing protein [uncultured Fretibacterium sp.]|uniref:helix-turn-helix transcriptional regulator n=1 Tax=uncultured Fretibacterium sp. TaxID=1678694 RepID=UPI00262060FD|nr:WYL domain-containing protein [uncultured Fretibacterium sp.]